MSDDERESVIHQSVVVSFIHSCFSAAGWVVGWLGGWVVGCVRACQEEEVQTNLLWMILKIIERRTLLIK